MLNVNKMRNVNRTSFDKNDNLNCDNEEDERNIAAFYRSKSQNINKPGNKSKVKSRVSSPADGSTSTVRGPIPIPTTLQGDIGVRNVSHINNEGRAWYSTIKKWKKTVNKTFLKGSSVEKHCDDNQ